LQGDDTTTTPADGGHGPLVAAIASSGLPATAALNAILGLLGAALAITALSLGRDLIVPLVLAVLLAFVLAPIVLVLRRARLPHVLAVVLAVLVAAAGILGLGMVMVRQGSTLVSELPAYQQNMRQKVQALRIGELLAEADLAMRDLRGMMGDGLAERAAPATPATDEAPTVRTAVPAAPATEGGGTSPLAVIQGIAGPVLAPLATAGIVVLFAIIVLIYREDLRDRVIRLAGSRDLHRTTVALNDAAKRLSRLFLAQVAVNATLGVVMSLLLWWAGLPSPALWGILAGLMRFVPFLGTFIALAPPLLLAIAVDPGWTMAIWVLALFLVVEPLMAQIVEPTVYGHSTGLSPVAVIIAATFWTFLWGPIGLLLATPLTVCMVVLGRHVPKLGFLDVMLGDRPSLSPPEAFYQRALQRDAEWLRAQARLSLKKGGSLAAYHDAVSLRGLVLADQDWSREVLEQDQLDDIRTEVQSLLASVAPKQPSAVARVACVSGRGSLDDLAATAAVQAAWSERIGAVMLADPAEVTEGMAEAVQLCCISVLEEGNSADGIRYLVRRWQRALPQARVVVGLWQADAASPMLAELRQDTAGETIVTSAGELVALCRALATPNG
jgi:predicted PurR-regulated permease PerM